MSFTLLSLRDALFLVIALTIDTFAASFSYGSSKIKISNVSVYIINGICTGLLAISLIFGFIIRPYLNEDLTKWICFLILFIIGISKLFDSSIKTLIKKNKCLSKSFTFSFSGLCMVLHIYADPTKADTDASHDISSAEAIALALALSLDGLAVGFGAALANVNILITIILSFLIGVAAIKLGSYLGNVLANKSSINFSWISGILMLLLAFMRLS